MDASKFDELIKQMSTTRITRTTALRGLVGGAAALVGARLALDEAAAKSGKQKHKHAGRGVQAAYANSVKYTGQGLIADGFGGYDLQTEICGVANGADVDGPYLLWVLTATGAQNADITGPWGTATMTKSGNGTFKYISGWYDPSSLPGHVTATYDGKAKNAQLTISHGCRPFTKQGAWCSPGFWGNAQQGAWNLVAPITQATGFNGNVSTAFYGQDLNPDASLVTVLTTSGGTYKGPGVAGTDPRTQSPNLALNPFNATGAFLTDHIPGYTYDPSLLSGDDSQTCPIDHFGHYKCCSNGTTCPSGVTC